MAVLLGVRSQSVAAEMQLRLGTTIRRGQRGITLLETRVVSLLREQRGFSLIETVIALGVLGLIGVAFLSALTGSGKATGRLSDGVQAEALIR